MAVTKLPHIVSTVAGVGFYSVELPASLTGGVARCLELASKDSAAV